MVALVINQGKILDVIDNPNQDKYLSQQIFVLAINQYVYLVPFIETEQEIFLKTIILSRKMKKNYLGETDDEWPTDVWGARNFRICRAWGTAFGPNLEQEIKRYQSYVQAQLGELQEIKIELSSQDIQFLQALANETETSLTVVITNLLHQFIARNLDAEGDAHDAPIKP